MKFQSTLPRGERHSFHILVVFAGNFNPRSHEGSDIDALDDVEQFDISIHAPTRGATGIYRTGSLGHYGFQSTLPRGERPITAANATYTAGISIHAPTRGATLTSYL